MGRMIVNSRDSLPRDLLLCISVSLFPKNMLGSEGYAFAQMDRL